MRASRRRHAPSRVTIYRPGATGALEYADTAPASGIPAAVVRGGQQYGLWDDLVQAWAHEAPETLEWCARELCERPGACAVSFWRGEYFPAPLNSAERTALRRMIEEGSE